MRTAEEAIRYANLFARAARAADALSYEAASVACTEGYDKAQAMIENDLMPAWRSGPNEILPVLEAFFARIESMDAPEKQQHAEALCKWMATNCCLTSCEDRTAFSLSALLWQGYNQTTEILSLNTNAEETGLLVIPHYSSCGAYRKTETGEIPLRLHNRDAFDGLNGALENLKLIPQSTETIVRHIILPEVDYPDNTFRCAFSPLSCKTDLLDIGYSSIEREGRRYKGVELKALQHEEELLRAFQTQWRRAAEVGAQLFFAPEMLCTDVLAEEENGYNKVVRRLSKTALADGLSPPLLTVLPSRWREKINSLTILFQDGRILGRQKKHFPYRNEKEQRIEALLNQPEKEVLLFHLPGAHRIAFLICADLLTQRQDYAEGLICRQLGATLLVLPSYSDGEQDFLNSLPSFKPYGTSAIWGNCCGAVPRVQRAIGGISIAGTDSVVRFGEACRCDGMCPNETACLFVAEFPIQLERNIRWDNGLRQIM